MDLNKLHIKSKFKKLKKKLAIKRKIKSKSNRLRISIYKSCRNLYVQIIDDLKQVTLCSSSTMDKEFKSDTSYYRCNKENAKKVAEMLVSKIKDKNLSHFVLDRNGYRYHGIIKVLAETLRENGVQI